MHGKLRTEVIFLIALLLQSIVLTTTRAGVESTLMMTLVKDSASEPVDLDPAWACDTASKELLMNIYETLLRFNRTDVDGFIPGLATEWKGESIDVVSPEGYQWVYRWYFKIREDTFFQDSIDSDHPGEYDPVLPSDIEYSFERVLITDAATGPAWMIWKPLTGGNSMWDVNASVGGPYTVADPQFPGENWSVLCDEVVADAVESNTTHVWFNLAMPYEPFLQIVAQTCGSILSQAWCIWHGDWTGAIDDIWVNYHNPAISPLYSSDSHSPGPNLDAALGSGPYMLDYWDRGKGGSWSVIKNPNYWRGWSVPYNPDGWGTDFTLDGHVDRYTSNYIPEWNTRLLRFLNGNCDFCDVPPQYVNQIFGQQGINCFYPLQYIGSEILCFNFNVSMSSTHMGMFGPLQRPLPPGFFNESGAPCDIFSDVNVRLGFAHLFDYMKYLEDAFLNESTSPVTPIVPGLAYYDITIGKPEDPSIDQRKEYGVSAETANQLAYDLALAEAYLQAAWGGLLWSQGFTMDLVCNNGDLERLGALELIRDGLYYLNGNFNTKFHVNIVRVSSSEYQMEMRQRTLPFFFVNWLADFLNTHGAVFPFMHSRGTYSRMQGFSNQTIDNLIDASIAAANPSEIQGYYSLLQQYYVDEALGMVLAKPNGSHFQKDWVKGWYSNVLYPGNYAYDLWKEVVPAIESVDVAITYNTTVCGLEIGYPVPDNPTMTVFPAIDVDVARLDTNWGVPTLLVVIGFGLRNGTGYEVIIGMEAAVLGVAGGGLDTYTATFCSFEQDASCPVYPGAYTAFIVLRVIQSWVRDTFMGDNSCDNAAMSADIMLGDVNVDGIVELMDFFLMSQAFGSYPGHSRWDVRCDLYQDEIVELMDFYVISAHFGEIYGKC